MSGIHDGTHGFRRVRASNPQPARYRRLMTVTLSLLFVVLQLAAAPREPSNGVRHPVLAWRLQTGGPVRSSPAIADGTVYVGGTDGRVYAIDVASGAELWTASIGGAVASTPALSTDRVFVSTRSNDVIALDRRFGKEVWRARTGPDIATHPGGEHWDYFSSSPTLAGDALFVGSGDGRLHALRAGSGTTIWTFKADGRIRGSPRVKDGTAIFGTIRGSVYAVSIADGRERWRFETDGYRIDSAAAGFDRTSVIAAPVFFGDLVYIGSRDGRFYALSFADGRERWRTKFEPSWVIAAAAVSNGAVIVATSDAQCVVAMDATTGQERWRFDAKARVLSSPLVTGDLVQVGLESGAMVALDANTGAERWRYQTDGPILSSPASTSDAVVVGSDDGAVYAWRDSPRGVSRAVFWDAGRRDRAYTPGVSERIAKHFAAAGYETLTAGTLAGYLRDRITDRRPSVVVFALDDLPDDVGGDAQASLLRQYLDAGGNAIWVGVVPPGYVRRNADGKPVEIRADAPERITGVAHDLGNGDAYGLRITADGTALGLAAWWLARGEASGEDVTTVLATDEFGRAAAWIKGFSGPRGTGYVRIWGSTGILSDVHLRDMRTVAERVVAASAR